MRRKVIKHIYLFHYITYILSLLSYIYDARRPNIFLFNIHMPAFLQATFIIFGAIIFSPSYARVSFTMMRYLRCIIIDAEIRCYCRFAARPGAPWTQRRLGAISQAPFSAAVTAPASPRSTTNAGHLLFAHLRGASFAIRARYFMLFTFFAAIALAADDYACLCFCQQLAADKAYRLTFLLAKR